MSATINTVKEQLVQLDVVRNVVLGDAALYPQMVEAVLPIIGANADFQLRRWGAEFLAETFASPALSQEPKQALAPTVLQTLHDLISNPNEDSSVVKFVVQTAASIYPLIFRIVYVSFYYFDWSLPLRWKAFLFFSSFLSFCSSFHLGKGKWNDFALTRYFLPLNIASTSLLRNSIGRS